MPVTTFGAELGAEFEQNKGNGEERDGDEGKSAVGPCAREVCNHYDDCGCVRSEDRKKGEGGGKGFAGGYLLAVSLRIFAYILQLPQRSNTRHQSP